MICNIKSISAFLISFVGSINCVNAQEIVHTFNNPSFGGNSFNSSHLLGLAEIQNRTEDPADAVSATTDSQTNLFVRQLQSRLLSSLSSSLSEAITGAEPGTSDTIIIGDQEIFYERTLDQVSVVITNLLDGSSTTIAVPVLDSAL